MRVRWQRVASVHRTSGWIYVPGGLPILQPVGIRWRGDGVRTVSYTHLTKWKHSTPKYTVDDLDLGEVDYSEEQCHDTLDRLHKGTKADVYKRQG